MTRRQYNLRSHCLVQGVLHYEGLLGLVNKTVQIRLARAFICGSRNADLKISYNEYLL